MSNDITPTCPEPWNHRLILVGCEFRDHLGWSWLTSSLSSTLSGQRPDPARNSQMFRTFLKLLPTCLGSLTGWPPSLNLPSPAQSWRAQFAHLKPAWHGCETFFPGCPAQETFMYDSWEVEHSPWSASWPQSSVWLAARTSLPTAGRGKKSSHVWSTLVQPWIIISPSLHLHYLAWVKSHQSGMVGLVE